MGKVSEKEWIYAELNHFAVHLKLTQHCSQLYTKIKLLKNFKTDVQQICYKIKHVKN